MELIFNARIANQSSPAQLFRHHLALLLRVGVFYRFHDRGYAMLPVMRSVYQPSAIPASRQASQAVLPRNAYADSCALLKHLRLTEAAARPPR